MTFQYLVVRVRPRQCFGFRRGADSSWVGVSMREALGDAATMQCAKCGCRAQSHGPSKGYFVLERH